MFVVALTGGQKAAILTVALVFIGFALLSAFVLPRRNPNFPGRHVLLFSLVSVGLFVAMLTAMAVFAKEDEEEAHEAVTTEFETGQGETTAPTDTGGGETQPPTDTGGETQPPPAAEGDAEPPARRCSPRAGARAATRCRPPARPGRSARTSTRPSRTTSSSSSA